MVPTSVISAAIFLLLVTPGMCYELLRSRTLLPREESAFIQISRILLSGTALTALSALMLAAANAIRPASPLLNVPSLLRDGASYVAANFARTTWTLLAQLSLAGLLAVILSDIRSRKVNRLIHQADAWHAIAEILATPGSTVVMSVSLKSGIELMGNYIGASTEFEPSKRELILGAPLYLRPESGGPTLRFDSAWDRMVVSGSEINYLATAYVNENQAKLPESIGHWARVGIWISNHYLTWQVASVTSLLILGIVVVLG